MQYGQSILSIVKLNVGGHYFTTSRQTLTRDPNSMLAAMFTGKFEMEPRGDGAFFIDRDGTHFRFILNYLRTGKLTSPEGEAALKELQEEAEFYQIEGLIEKLKVNQQSLTSVKLNVGGHQFTTSLQTLTKDPNSMLAAMFSGKFEMKPHEDGTFFIDRDGTHFRFILNYLRTGKLTLPDGAKFLKELTEEAEFYQIRGILDKLKLMTESLTSVKLNVGGHHFTTSLQTLTKDPNSRLAAMFSGEHDENSTIFLDRDGKHFRFILNYLRNGELVLPDDAKFVKELETEAQFYKIEGILIRLSLFSEILTNEEHISVLLSWLPVHYTGMRRRHLRLLYRASRDGFAAECFHSRCDNNGPTVTIVKSGEYIFGGFTEQSWTSQNHGSNYTEAFLFSMVNPHGREPTKIPLTPHGHERAISCRADLGPTFGRGYYGKYALQISDHANISYSESNGYENIYNFPPERSTFFTGNPTFVVTDYEVFSLN